MIAVAGWGQAASIAEGAYSASTAVLTVTGKFTVAAQDFMAHGTAYPSSLVSYTTALGSDSFGAYHDYTLTLTYTAGANAVVRLRFYDGTDLVEFFETTPNATVGQTRLRATFASASSQWFTLCRGYYYGNNHYISGLPQTSWTATFPAATEQNPNGESYDSTPEHTGGHWGYPYVSGQLAGIAEYVDTTSAAGRVVTDTHLLQPSWRYIITPTYVEARVTKAQTGFVLTACVGYRGMSEVTKWHHRATPTRSYPANAFKPYMVLAGDYWTSGTGATGFFYDTSDITAHMAYFDAQGAVCGMVDLDLRWYDYAGDYNFRTDRALTGAVSTITTAGKIACAYMTPWIEAASTAYASADAAFKGGATRTHGWNMIGQGTTPGEVGFRGWGLHYYDPFTAAGKTAIEAVAAKIVSLGFGASRIDMGYGNVYDTYAWMKVYSDHVRTLDPDHIIEAHMLYCSPWLDRVRSNDLGPHAYTGDIEAIQDFRLKNTLVHAHGRFIDCDIVGMNDGNGTTYDRTLQQAKMARMFYQQLGYGGYAGPEFAWPEAWMTTLMGTVSPKLALASTLPREIPTRAITGDWETSFSTLLTYPNGATLAYDAPSDTVIAPNLFDLATQFIPAVLRAAGGFGAMAGMSASAVFDLATAFVQGAVSPFFSHGTTQRNTSTGRTSRPSSRGHNR